MAASNAQCPEDMLSQSRSCQVSQGQGLSKAQGCDVADVAHISFTLAASAPNSDQTSEPLVYTEWINEEAGNSSMFPLVSVPLYLLCPPLGFFYHFFSLILQHFLQNLSLNLIMSTCYRGIWLLAYISEITLGNTINWTLEGRCHGSW